MRKSVKQFLKVFNREWNERFQLVDANGVPIKPFKDLQEDDEELTEEEMEYEMKLAEDIGNYLDSALEKIESGEEEEKL